MESQVEENKGLTVYLNERNRSRLTGEAGVHRVAAELLLRGLIPSFPSVDCGHDLVVDAGVRIQVKATRKRFNSVYPEGAYWFKLAHGCGKKRGQRRNFSKDCDFVAFWGIEEDRFWIVPAASCDNHSLVVVGPDLHWKGLDVEQIKMLHAQGMTQEEIAEKFNVDGMTISRRLRGIHVEPSERRTLTAEVRRCEGNWDAIISMVMTMVEVESQSAILQQR